MNEEDARPHLDYVAYLADISAKTQRDVGISAPSDEEALEEARKLCRTQNEHVVLVERLRDRRYRVMLKRTRIYRTYIDGCSLAGAIDEVQRQAVDEQDEDWEWRETESIEVLSVEEVE